MARLRQAQGHLDGALTLLHEAEHLFVSDFFPNVPIAAWKSRVWVAQGRLGDALDWARERGLSAHDDLSYLREFEHLPLARVLLAQYKSERAERVILEVRGLLERLLQAAEAGERAPIPSASTANSTSPVAGRPSTGPPNWACSSRSIAWPAAAAPPLRPLPHHCRPALARCISPEPLPLQKSPRRALSNHHIWGRHLPTFIAIL
jgi:hypothetical protein